MDDFEIIEKADNCAIKVCDDNNKDMVTELNFFQKFISSIFKIILGSRNQSNRFYSISKKNLADIKNFAIDYLELIEYEIIQNPDIDNTYFIDFFLINRINKKSLLIEKWIINYENQ